MSAGRIFRFGGAGQMADLHFTGTTEERRAQVESFCQRISSDFYGNGRPGMMDEVTEYLTTQRTIELIRDRQHQENKEKADKLTKRANLIIGLLMLLIAIIAAGPAIRKMFGKTILPDFFSQHQIQLAHRAQDATLPPMR